MTSLDSAPQSTKRVILVNGVPGAGKSTLARQLAHAWNAKCYSKDTLKDLLAESCPQEPDPAWLSTEAEDLLWFLTARADRAVIETWFGSSQRARHIESRLDAAHIPLAQVCEVWCDVPMPVARGRFLTRAQDDTSRHPRHLQAGADPQWWESLRDAHPLGLTDVITVDTTTPITGARVQEILHKAQIFR